MKIESAAVYMNSISAQKKVSRTTETLRAWVGKQPTTQNLTENQVKDGAFQRKDFNEKLRDALAKTSIATSRANQYEVELLSISDEDEGKISLFNKLLEILLGKRMKFFVPTKIVFQQGPALQGWGLDYQKQEYYSEEQTMSFNSGGTIKTADGREIQFDLNLNLSRSFASESQISVKAGDALIDPLVINFDQPAAALTQNKFSFDLDNDGKVDNISFTKTGSGFLVYDKNKDGVINNGNELFGPKTGNGFTELAELDADGNNWIDENDPIYDKLQIWTKDADGIDHLFAIGEKGIGAIYLGSVNSPFSIKDGNNETQGQIEQTGIFLREDGTAGTIQHVDFSL